MNDTSKTPGRDRRSPTTRARERSAQLRAEDAKRQARRSALIQAGVIVGGAAIVVAIVVGVLVARDGNTSTAGSATPANLTNTGGYVAGNPDAAVTVTVVEDFQCPYCQVFEQQVGDLLGSYAQDDQVKVEYRPVALLDQASSTRYSSRALNGAACVLDSNPGVFPAFHEALFANQPPEQTAGLPDDTLIDLAVEAGVAKSDIESCVNDEKFADWVEATTAKVTNDPDFSGTPWVRVNGTTVPTPSAESIKAAVEAAQN